MTHRRSHPPRRSRRGAVSLAEVLVSMLIVSGLLVSALNTLGGANAARMQNVDRMRGHMLAEQLMTEIIMQPYEDPDTTPTFGLEANENTMPRTSYDDVDDYRGYNATSTQRKDGTPVLGFTGWTRKVAVDWVDPANPDVVSAVATDVKRITVSALKGDRVIATTVALRTAGPPEPNTAVAILMVVSDTTLLNAQEAARKALLESWGYQVDLINASDTQTNFDAATANVVAAYVPNEIVATQLATKLRLATVGVVNEHPDLTDEFGFCSSSASGTSATLRIFDNTHYILSTFAVGDITTFSSSQPLFEANGTMSLDVTEITYVPNGPTVSFLSMMALDTGMTMYGAGTTPARRVQMSWGGPGFDINSLTADGRTLLQRSLEWVAGAN